MKFGFISSYVDLLMYRFYRIELLNSLIYVYFKIKYIVKMWYFYFGFWRILRDNIKKVVF